MQKNKFVVHVDMDAFFAAIEQRDNPQFHSKPVVVGADPKGGRGRGVVSTCSYEARKFGIHSAMPISIAYQKCPHAIFLPVNMEKYESVSGQIYEILYSFTPDIEPISIDEAFLDISHSYHLFGTPVNTCLLMKSRIKDGTGLTASIGLAPTKMAAKIASDLKKPDGMVEVSLDGLLDFLWPLSVRKLWGLGGKCEEVLTEMGIKTIGDLASRDVRELIKVFGKNGEYFWKLANGIDERPVESCADAKSISSEITFEEDTHDRDKIDSAMMCLCQKVSSRLRQGSFKCRTITLKIRLKGFQTFTRSATMEKATNFIDILYKQAKDLYNDFDAKGKKVRLVGVRASNLSPADFQDSLFKDSGDDKREEVHSAVDRIKEKFGDGAIYRASSLS